MSLGENAKKDVIGHYGIQLKLEEIPVPDQPGRVSYTVKSIINCRPVPEDQILRSVYSSIKRFYCDMHAEQVAKTIPMPIIAITGLLFNVVRDDFFSDEALNFLKANRWEQRRPNEVLNFSEFAYRGLFSNEEVGNVLRRASEENIRQAKTDYENRYSFKYLIKSVKMNDSWFVDFEILSPIGTSTSLTRYGPMAECDIESFVEELRIKTHKGLEISRKYLEDGFEKQCL